MTYLTWCKRYSRENNGRFPFDQILRTSFSSIRTSFSGWLDHLLTTNYGWTNPPQVIVCQVLREDTKKRRKQIGGLLAFFYLLWSCSTTLKLKGLVLKPGTGERWNAGTLERWNGRTPERRNAGILKPGTPDTETRNAGILRPTKLKVLSSLIQFC